MLVQWGNNQLQTQLSHGGNYYVHSYGNALYFDKELCVLVDGKQTEAAEKDVF